jgi:hypothetical protein
VRRPLWKNILHGRLGYVTVNTKEPSPLAYTADDAHCSTKCVLHFTLEGDLTALEYLRYATVKVKPTICAKTYYAPETIHSMPTQSLITDHLPICMHTDLANLDSQEFRDFQWTFSSPERFVHEPDEQQGEDAPRYAQDAPSRRSAGVSQTGNVMSLGRLGSQSSVKQGAAAWHTSVPVHISPPRRLLPNFCSGLIARSYALLFHVSLGGVHASKLYLAVPLQVAYPRPPTLLSQADGNPSQQTEGGEGADHGHRASVPIRLRTHVSSNPGSADLFSFGADVAWPLRLCQHMMNSWAMTARYI